MKTVNPSKDIAQNLLVPKVGIFEPPPSEQKDKGQRLKEKGK